MLLQQLSALIMPHQWNHLIPPHKCNTVVLLLHTAELIAMLLVARVYHTLNSGTTCMSITSYDGALVPAIGRHVRLSKRSPADFTAVICNGH